MGSKESQKLDESHQYMEEQFDDEAIKEINEEDEGLNTINEEMNQSVV